ncbi:MAG: hypothetical protein HHJ11_06175 [Phycicoccus sp.]|nr:hypothetical protein [Phycicoccus sp.]NMM34302.1 hypothetical protein [Phycicoccus sp.]
MINYQLTLSDPSAGVDPTQTSDTFSRLLLEAEDNLYAPIARGRGAACSSYRAAAERLAKQIIATGRTRDGQPCAVAHIDAEAPMLRELVRLRAATPWTTLRRHSGAPSLSLDPPANYSRLGERDSIWSSL